MPAGCGGVVLRWIRPEGPVVLQFWIELAGEGELCLDGQPLGRSKVEVDPGEHALTVELSQPRHPGLVLGRIEMERRPTPPLNTAPGTGWRWTAVQPRPGSPAVEPVCTLDGVDAPRFVLRGGSWADCGEACTTTFRSALASRHWSERGMDESSCPNVGFRLARTRPA